MSSAKKHKKLTNKNVADYVLNPSA